MNLRRILLTLIMMAGCLPADAEDYRETVLADRPSVYWCFEDPNGNRVRDESKFIDGRIIATGPGRRGVFGLAAAFGRSQLAGRVESRLDAEQDKAIERILNGSFSLEFWVLDEAAAPDNKVNYSVFYKADVPRFSKNSIWFYRARQDGNYHFRIHGSNGERAGLTVKNPAGDNAVGDGRWHHIVVAVSRSEAKATMAAILDGRKVAEAAVPAEIRIDNEGPLVVGNGTHPNSPWQGLIDEFAIYPRVLNEAEIRRHFTAGLSSMKQPMKVTSPLAAREEFFELKIRPLLIEKCSACHSGEADSESVLSVNSRRALLDGGDYGPAIIPRRAEDSLLIHAARRTHKELHMPPEKADSLSREEVSALTRWIDDGAVWPKGKDERLPSAAVRIPRAEQRELALDPVENWALLPRRIVEPPRAVEARWAGSGIDRFLEKSRRGAGLSAVRHTDRRTLIRRATFDLTGLPPSPEEVQAFLANQSDEGEAWVEVLDRLLASRHYGERAGRLWLDVARYADTQGDVGDIPIQKAWLYRNWVIDAMNQDLPFDEFLRAQIAGDLLARNETDERTARGLTVATGFVSLSRRFGNTKNDDIHLTIEDTIDTLGRGVLGLTLRCARCHDHKFDPILNTDYYGLYGIFESTVYPSMGMSNEKSPSNLSPAIPNRKAFEEADRYWALITRYEYQINNHFRPWLKPTLDEFQSISKNLESNPAPEKLKELQARREELLSVRGGKFRELMLHGLAWIKSEKKRLAENPPIDFVFAVADGEAHDSMIHRRGNPRRLGAKTPRRFLQVLDGPKPPEIIAGSGRLELARWLTRPDHPLTARVIVNRLWQQHFGRGLVATPDNFGRQGAKPSHPELLDWLAEQFVQDGWSLKKLHRRIMLSESYRLSSTFGQELLASDPENIYLTRFPRRRLDAESIRDSLLSVSGQLDRSQGEAHEIAPWYSSRFSLNNPFHIEPVSNRRSVYLLTQRLFRHSFLGLFDGPDRNSSTSSRGVSNGPSQALFLMNSRFVKEQASALAVRVEAEAATEEQQITRIFQLAVGREADAGELKSLKGFLVKYRSAAGQTDENSTPSPGLIAVCRAVLTSNEFFFID
jgi:hypothetical protein